MAHFAPWPHEALAVNMQPRLPRHFNPFLDFVADDVLHNSVGIAFRIAQRPSGDRTDMLFELADGAGFQCPMAGIMDARSDLIDQQLAFACHKEFDTENAGIVQRLRNMSRQEECLLCAVRG